MSWVLRYSKRAKKDAEHLHKAGLAKQIKKLLDVLMQDPYRSPPPFEKLSGELRGKFSRRINRQHRLVYEVLLEEKIINILQMWTHYE